jgi:hypothetical protein
MKQIKDPQCAGVTTQQSLQASCTLNAVTDANGQLLLQNPLPGRRGTLGMNRLQGPGLWRFDGNMSKSIKINETKSVQFRFDAMDVLNHPEPATPLVNIDAANFGLITGTTAKSTLHRQFQGQLRFTF